MESSFNKKIGNIYYLLTMLLLFCIPIEPLIGKLYKLLKILYIFIFIIFFFSWRKKRNVNIYYLIFSIFVFLACFSIIYTGHKQSSISMAQELILNFLLALGISFKIRVNNDLENANSEIEKYFYSFSFGTFVITLYLLIFELPNLGRWTRLGQELYSNYGSYMVYSYCEIISMTYLIWNLFLTEKKRKKSIFIFDYASSITNWSTCFRN